MSEYNFAKCSLCGSNLYKEPNGDTACSGCSFRQYLDEDDAKHTLWEDKDSAHAQIDITL